ncbi:hypothetical protein CMQ_8089 [Grosmannia clavigera kw1407]|uniref:Uncharacterized protein n=1 Tax=Grosmannia clavigera (strain kw1407 / UAMH 11150) TaxID=655863 RepID=F0XKI8_GROCL|nr:uncharacterized protein CMQ_8089 [Grosmannia clavigera kw1407]EFX01623.1 hypothetical protein CMQ_8089 [Grosmannia clavigera kw1407]
MCQWTQRNYSCGHVRYVAAEWCRSYRMRKQRCSVDVTNVEDRCDELCASCRPRQVTPQHASYINSIYKDLCQKHPDRDWEKIRVLAEPGPHERK